MEMLKPHVALAATPITIPKIIHFVVPESPSAEQLKIIETAIALHPEWAVKVWNDKQRFPEIELDKYLSKTTSGAQAADLIRLMAVYTYGGVYLDSDMQVHRPLDKLVEEVGFFIASEDGYNLTNACFGASAGHPALGAIIEHLLRLEPDWNLPPNVTTGPELYAKLLRWRSDISVLPRETFYPYHHYHAVKKVHALSYCEHLWAGSWLEGWTWTEFGYSRGAQQVPPKASASSKRDGRCAVGWGARSSRLPMGSGALSPGTFRIFRRATPLGPRWWCQPFTDISLSPMAMTTA